MAVWEWRRHDLCYTCLFATYAINNIFEQCLDRSSFYMTRDEKIQNTTFLHETVYDTPALTIFNKCGAILGNFLHKLCLPHATKWIFFFKENGNFLL